MASSRSNVAANSSIDCVEELEAYLKASSVEHEIKEMMKAMFEAKPSNSVTWMIQYLVQRAGSQSDSNICIAAGSDVTLLVSSSTRIKQESLVESKLAPILHNLACKVVNEAPAAAERKNVLSLITTHSHYLMKNTPQEHAQELQ